MSSNSEVTVVTLLKRKPGMSREAFIEYYEARHAVLATRVVPGLIDYRRIYIDPDHMAFGMPPASPGYDVITMLVFADAAAYQSAFHALSGPAAVAPGPARTFAHMIGSMNHGCPSETSLDHVGSRSFPAAGRSDHG
jgi:hypothetical protein